MPSFDVIVIGVGTMGSAVCSALASRGVRVLGLEQFGIPHASGSHHGHSRMFRMAYYEHADYVPLLRRAFDGWKELEMQARTELFHVTGGVYLGPRGCEKIVRSAESAVRHGLAHERPSLDEVRRRWPQFAPPEGFEAMYEPTAGFVVPELAVAAFAQLAMARGAVLRAHEPVRSWRADGSGFEVITDAGTYLGAKLIICPGAWASRVVRDLGVQVTPTRQILGWVWPRRPDRFGLGEFPVWAAQDEAGTVFYGFPMTGSNPGLKLARHAKGTVADPDRVERGTLPGDDEDFRAGLRFLRDSDGPTLARVVCTYENSPDAHFIIDRHPRHEHVSVACGFSGHGFKFAPVIGEILADLAQHGRTAHPIGFLGLSRFASRG